MGARLRAAIFLRSADRRHQAARAIAHIGWCSALARRTIDSSSAATSSRSSRRRGIDAPIIYRVKSFYVPGWNARPPRVPQVRT